MLNLRYEFRGRLGGMRVILFENYKQPVIEKDVPEPSVGDHDVLIRVEAASINHIDARLQAGEFKVILPYKMPVTLGHDLAGTILATGVAVTRFKSGDQVYARPRDFRIGTFAEKISVHEDDVALTPRSISTVEAASLPLVALTAWQALVDLGTVQAGQKVLIHAGAGGVGSIAIQIAKHLGAEVATTVSAKNIEFVRSLGADIAIDYRTQDFESELESYDFVLDSLGGANLEKSLKVVRRGGIVVGISGPPTPTFAREAGLNPVVRLAVAAMSFKTRRLARNLGVTYKFLLMKSSGEQLAQLAKLVDSGVVRPIVGATHPFEEAVSAIESLGTSGALGKEVLLGPGFAVDQPTES